MSEWCIAVSLFFILIFIINMPHQDSKVKMIEGGALENEDDGSLNEEEGEPTNKRFQISSID